LLGAGAGGRPSGIAHDASNGPPRSDRPKAEDGPFVKRLTLITEDGGRLDWSARNNVIAFDRLGEDRYFDIFTMDLGGSDVRCLTCDKPGLPNKSIGNPAWHPSGDYIVFQAQNTYRGLGRLTDYFANPGAGVNNDVWVMDRDGRRFWQLTKVEPRSGGVLHPQFSSRGDKLLWAERLDSRNKWGTWSLKVADFVVEEGRPRIRDVRTLQPGKQHRMYESHGFSPDGRKVLFSGNLEPGQEITSGDIYLYDLSTGDLQNLTQTTDEWDEHAHFSPDGRTIVWMTNKGQPRYIRTGQPRTDYWMMNADGSNKRRLTYFNEQGYPESMKGAVTAADFAWSPDGRRIAAYLITDVRKGGRIVMLDLDWGGARRR
jgi:Tol biopolymer transport system component